MIGVPVQLDFLGTDEMLRLVLLSLVLSVCQCKLCDYESWVGCNCFNDAGKLLFTTSHISVDEDEWDTTIVKNGGICDRDSAGNLWNNITGRDKCRPTLSPTPPRGERPSESKMIDKGYERHGYSLYKFHTQTQDWENARRTCMAEGAHLAIVNTEQEAKILERIFYRYPFNENSMVDEFALIGFHDQFTDGKYLTIFGDPIKVAGYALWANDNPDNKRKDYNGHPGENCGSISRKGKLNDVPCWGKYAFFCEREDGDYPPPSEINYIAGYYTGVEAVIKPPPGTQKREMPSSGYTYFPGVGFYKMHTRTETWENARRICESEDAHLAIINSQHESAVLSLIFSEQKTIYDALWNDFAFIGFHDQYKEGEFLTVFNEPLESTGFTEWWSSNDPNNFGASNTEVGQDCGGVNRNGGLNDMPCHKRCAFFCEQPLLV